VRREANVTPVSHSVRGRLSALALAAALAWPASAHAADPLLMFMLGFAKNLIESAIEENRARQKPPAVLAAPVPAPAVVTKPPAEMDASDLRALVDDSFGYLGTAQRNELLAGLEQALSDPANEPYREQILTQFTTVARQVRFAHHQLDRLSDEDKRALAERFAANYRSLTPEQQQALTQQLRARALPLPADLNDMMLSALASAQ
jgi:hypothetical protein